MNEYRWSHPLEWFEEYLERNDVDAKYEALQIATKLSGDEIQDIYQSEMEEDGYFESLEK